MFIKKHFYLSVVIFAAVALTLGGLSLVQISDFYNTVNAEEDYENNDVSWDDWGDPAEQTREELADPDNPLYNDSDDSTKSKSSNQPALYRAENDDKVYEVIGERKRWIKTLEEFGQRGFDWGQVQVVPEKELSGYPYLELLRERGESEVYVVRNSNKYWIESEEAFNQGGYDWDQVVNVNSEQLSSYPDGESLGVFDTPKSINSSSKQTSSVSDQSKDRASSEKRKPSADCGVCEWYNEQSGHCVPKCADEDEPLCCAKGTAKEGQCIAVDGDCGGMTEKSTSAADSCGICEIWNNKSEVCQPLCEYSDNVRCCSEGTDKEGRCIASDESCNYKSDDSDSQSSSGGSDVSSGTDSASGSQGSSGSGTTGDSGSRSDDRPDDTGGSTPSRPSCGICEEVSPVSGRCRPKCADSNNPVCCPAGTDRAGSCISLGEVCNYGRAPIAN